MNKFLNSHNQDLLKFAEENSEKYKNGIPFPSISFENFFNPELLEEVLSEFPDLSKQDAISFNDPLQKKFAGKGEKSFGPKTRELMYFLNSEPFLNFVNKVTGINEILYGDPYFSGGGLHEIKRGGLLKVHADFNKNPTTGLDRRVNVLVYLNKEWKDEYGGHFELWNQDMTKCETKIAPKFNTLAMFSTTSNSYHGHPDPLNCPEERSRKSLALYYYSNGRPESEAIAFKENHNTLFVQRKDSHKDTNAWNENEQRKKQHLSPKTSLAKRVFNKIFRG
ncbi:MULTISPECIES: 2OG-Fe(II) oxygenase [Chryseobacterium]|uniref:2OG-Fe(II) oxygenase n=1 Tax=Candidatus Chryseobacterium massiliense TaxID=204089 RepID=A0A3D9BEF7_9FLAO|nr:MULTISPECIES: 2OG-Fe(II) oxygenase [Chryseobacterium]REC51731.1 2OG-Fe(II) oxygenase [Candidatus Chryseobacterium massiliae]